MNRTLISLILWVITSFALSSILAPFIPSRLLLILVTIVATYYLVKFIMRHFIGVNRSNNNNSSLF
ncbi:MAG: hypothetical protein Q7J34_11050 [Bacteroidales bacterium]|nr:hypothetical protein [Bacteroidales bacterium]